MIITRVIGDIYVVEGSDDVYGLHIQGYGGRRNPDPIQRTYYLKNAKDLKNACDMGCGFPRMGLSVTLSQFKSEFRKQYGSELYESLEELESHHPYIKKVGKNMFEDNFSNYEHIIRENTRVILNHEEKQKIWMTSNPESNINFTVERPIQDGWNSDENKHKHWSEQIKIKSYSLDYNNAEKHLKCDNETQFLKNADFSEYQPWIPLDIKEGSAVAIPVNVNSMDEVADIINNDMVRKVKYQLNQRNNKETKNKGEKKMEKRISLVESYYKGKLAASETTYKEERAKFIEESVAQKSANKVNKFIVDTFNSVFAEDIEQELTVAIDVKNASYYDARPFYTSKFKEELEKRRKTYVESTNVLSAEKVALYERLELCGDTPDGNTVVEVLKSFNIMEK